MSVSGPFDGRNALDGRNSRDGRNTRDGRNARTGVFHPGGPSSGQLSSAILFVAQELAAGGKFDEFRKASELVPEEDFEPSAEFRQFARLEAFYRETILDYEVNRLVAPLDSFDTAAFLKSGGPNLSFFELNKPKNGKDLDIYLSEQMSFLKKHMVLRDERFTEILLQQTDMLSFFGALAPLDASRTPWALALIDAVLRFGTYIVTPFKLMIDGSRPNEFQPLVQPMIQTPTHGTLPSGHALEAFSVATVLVALAETKTIEKVPGTEAQPFDVTSSIAEKKSLFMRLAARIAHNRTVAGVHFPIDNFVGAAMGLAIGEYFVNAVAQTGKTGKFSIDMTKVDSTGTPLNKADFLFENISIGAADPVYIKRDGHVDIKALTVSQILQDIWILARREVQAPDAT